MIFFDIETEAQDLNQIQDLLEPVAAPSNWKDPEKIAAKEAEMKEAQLERAALSPMIGRIYSINTKLIGEQIEIAHTTPTRTERHLLEYFFGMVQEALTRGTKLAGWNIRSFDLPFIARRALLLGVSLPEAMKPNGSSRFYWPSVFVDLRDVWGFGELNPEGSLDRVGRAMGFAPKPFSGKHFAAMHRSASKVEVELAYLYAEIEFQVMESIAFRIGVA